MFILYIIVMFGLNAFLTGVNVMQKCIIGSILGAAGAIAAFLVLVSECVCR